MLSEPRTISLLTDLLHVPTKAAVKDLREVYNELCTTCGYENFIRTADGARIEHADPEGREFSRVSFRQDRVTIVEDHTSLTLEQYSEKIEAVARATMNTLRMPFFLVQQVTVRAITSPNRFKSATQFLQKALLKVSSEDLQTLGRPTEVFGLRLLFPATKEEPYQFTVRVEKYVRDPRSIYIENVGVFKQPIQYQGLASLGQNVQAAADFVSNNVCEFLSQYDQV